MQFSVVNMTTVVLAGLASLALGAPAANQLATDTLLVERACDCDCNKKCQKNCLNGFPSFGAFACVLSCAPNCGCSENSKC
ncbi:hypothetical protein KVR01_004330 [Diaporthe batatas]|uniref:uncharacterized protein n=1 Tax=Diaporthe batatas TaxID=748121 RepID=UPI001D056ACD|nr:uncharacterized protein KVR01_004330 [Diaporthe batatas]KAG8165778.1 hypothetical protein KVR01_004330 [Diaporthe batatas]